MNIGNKELIVNIVEIDESTRQIAEEDSSDGRWNKGDEVALVLDDFHRDSWGWACVKDNNGSKQ